MESGTSRLTSRESNEKPVADFEFVTRRDEERTPFLKLSEVKETIALEEQDGSRLKGFAEMDIEEQLLVASPQPLLDAKICLCIDRSD